MKFDKKNSELFDYYDSLPQKIKGQIDMSDVHISTVGELMLIAEHYNQQQEVPDEF